MTRSALDGWRGYTPDPHALHDTFFGALPRSPSPAWRAKEADPELADDQPKDHPPTGLHLAEPLLDRRIYIVTASVTLDHTEADLDHQAASSVGAVPAVTATASFTLRARN